MPENDKSQKRLMPKKIAALRKSLNLSREVLARKLGVSHMTVFRWENSADSPSPTNLLALGRIAPDDQREFFFDHSGIVKDYLTESGSFSPLGAHIALTGGGLAHPAAPAKINSLTDEHGAPIDGAGFAYAILFRGDRKIKPESLVVISVRNNDLSPLLEEGYLAIVDSSNQEWKSLQGKLVAVKVKDGVIIRWLHHDGVHDVLDAERRSGKNWRITVSNRSEYEMVGRVISWVGTTLGATG